MFLTNILLKPKAKRTGIGRWIGRGKNKKFLISKFDIGKAKQNLKNEEENMLLLRHPYLRFEQSFGHMEALGKPDVFIAQKLLNKPKVKPDVTFEERYGGLKVMDVWDV